MTNQNMQPPPKAECSAFCPQCGTDLYYLDGTCYCKNKSCSYSCDKCKQQKDALFFSDDN